MEEIEGSRYSLSGLEKFNLAAAIIGLFADGVGLITFFTGLWSFENTVKSNAVFYLYIIATGLVILYGWGVISWILTRRKILQYEILFDRRIVLNSKAGSTVAGVGIALIPIVAIWFIVTYLGVFAEELSTEPFGETIPTTEISTLVPMSETPITNGVGQTKNTPDYSSAFGYTVISLMFVYPFLGIGVFASISFLMPISYSDIPSPDDRALRSIYVDKMKETIDTEWAIWEERLILEIERHKWVTVHDLQDFADLLDVPIDAIEMAFATFANRFPKEVRYGYLYNEDNWRVSEYKVLVNVHSDLEGKYFEADM